MIASNLPPDMRPFVLLELGQARVVPFLERNLSSWVHDLDDPYWNELQGAWERIGPMFWGPRVALVDACAAIRAFLAMLLRE